MKALKIIPLLIMVAGIGGVASFGGDVVKKLVTRVEVLVTGLEVMNIAEEVRFFYLSYGELPGFANAEEFGRFLNANFSPYYGNRQPSEDLFGNGYILDDAEGSEGWFPAVFSLGPNGVEDSCALLDGSKQVVGQPGDAAGVAIADDVCVSLEHALRDTPFERKTLAR